MSKVVFAEYGNTGGNCWCMFAEVANCREMGINDMSTIWLIGSVDCYDVPTINFYSTERGAYDGMGEDDEDYMGEADTERNPWTIELWKEMFRYAIENEKLKCLVPFYENEYRTFIENL